MKYDLEVVSPLHVGGGGVICPIEYVVGDKFYRADMDGLFADERFNSARFMEDTKGGLLYLGRFAPELAKEHIRYVLDIPQPTQRNLQSAIGSPSGEVREFIKNARGVYIPGSSIKGAIRTAILWWVLKTDPSKLERLEHYLDGLLRSGDRINRKYVGDSVEKDVFGKDPTHDLLKALQISDTNTIAPDKMMIEEARILTTSLQGHNWKHFSIFLEALKPETNLNFEMKIEDFYLEGDASKRLNFERKEHLLRDLPKICNAFADELINYEISFFKRYNTPRALEGVLDFLNDLKAVEQKKENSFLLHFSWGSGWHGTTVGRLLDPDLLWDLRSRLGLGKRGVPEFPKTRRLVFEDGKPKYPLGWVKVERKNE